MFTATFAMLLLCQATSACGDDFAWVDPITSGATSRPSPTEASEDSVSDTGPADPTEADPTGGPTCGLLLTYVAGDPINQRPWARALHEGCDKTLIATELLDVYLHNDATDTFSLPGNIPTGPGYPTPYTDTCVILMWGANKKAPKWSVTRAPSMSPETILLSWTVAPDYNPESHSGVHLFNGKWSVAPAGSELLATCEGF